MGIDHDPAGLVVLVVCVLVARHDDEVVLGHRHLLMIRAGAYDDFVPGRRRRDGRLDVGELGVRAVGPVVIDDERPVVPGPVRGEVGAPRLDPAGAKRVPSAGPQCNRAHGDRYEQRWMAHVSPLFGSKTRRRGRQQ